MTEQTPIRRRLAAILAADIAGYSRLMGQDEAGTVRDLKGHQAVVLPLVSQHDGRIIDTAGDGILAEFPSVTDATACALEIQAVMTARNEPVPEDRRMQFRIGINLGDVIFDDDRIYGDGINVAARLEGLADPGGILVSQAVYEQVRFRLQVGFDDLGEQDLKNIAHPVRVYRLRMNLGRSGGSTTRAVFLSYASQDAGTARKIAESLRSVGIEVWFDQAELQGGDAWDRKIRQQIQSCTLFVPIISAHTESRPEGYFRLEWWLAEQRSFRMARGMPFVVPVAVDVPAGTQAKVPDAFRDVQWTKMNGGRLPVDFAARVQALLSGGSGHAAPAGTRSTTAPPAEPAMAPDDTPSVAVLPFVNMSGDEENEYFSDGLAEELLNVLAKIRGLRVASRTSAFSFKGKNIDIPTVAEKLNVATILEGSVRKAGKRVRITVQLIEVASDSHLWSETYNRELDDIFAVQDDIAQSVVEELRTTLLGKPTGTLAANTAAAEVRQAAAGRSSDPEAYRLYLQGRFFGDRVTQAGTDKAIALFRQALSIDPDFALAWTGLARVYQTQAGFGFAPIAEGYARAREAAENALRLSPGLAEAHIQLGMVSSAYDWNWKAADASLRRALELAPGNADALHAAAHLARVLRRSDEGRKMIQQAVAIDPLSVHMYRELGISHWLDGDLEGCAATLERALDLDANAGLAHAFLALTRLEQGRTEEALELAHAEGHGVFRNVAVAIIQHALGHAKESDAALQAIIDGFGWTAAYQVAEVYSYRGEIDKAFEWLETAFAQRDPGVTSSAGDPYLKPLHGDPRWLPFLRKIGLAPEQLAEIPSRGTPPA